MLYIECIYNVSMTRCVITYMWHSVHILCLIKLTMIATQELVVPKSIPITSPASLELIHLLFVCCNWEERPKPIVDCIDVLVVALVANDIEDRRPNWSAMIALFVLLAWLISIPRKMMLLIIHYSEPNGVDYSLWERARRRHRRRSFHSPAFCRSFFFAGDFVVDN